MCAKINIYFKEAKAYCNWVSNFNVCRLQHSWNTTAQLYAVLLHTFQVNWRSKLTFGIVLSLLTNVLNSVDGTNIGFCTCLVERFPGEFTMDFIGEYGVLGTVIRNILKNKKLHSHTSTLLHLIPLDIINQKLITK